MPTASPLSPSDYSIFLAISVRLGIIALIGALGIYVLYLVIKNPTSMETDGTSRVAALRSIYFYLTSFVGLMLMVIALASMVNIALKATIFTKADSYAQPTPEEDCSPERLKALPTLTPAQCEKKAAESRVSRAINLTANRQSNLADDFGMLIIGIPLFAYHFSVIQGRRSALKK